MSQLFAKSLIVFFLSFQALTASALYCHELFDFKNVSKRYILVNQSPALKPLKNFLESLESKPQKIQVVEIAVREVEWANGFKEAYKQAVEKVESAQELLTLFSLVKEILDHRYSKILHSVSSHPTKDAFAEVFQFNHYQLFARLKDQLNREQKLELLDILFFIQKNSPTSTRANYAHDAVWRWLWLAKLTMFPQLTMQEIHSLLAGEKSKIEDLRMVDADLWSIREHTPDIIDAFINLPGELKEKYRKLFIQDFYMLRKNSKAHIFLQKINHALLRTMVNRLESKARSRKLTPEQAIKIVDEYWHENGFKEAPWLGGQMRGGYSFQKVIDAALKIQAEMNKRKTWYLFPRTMLMFGSFPNGMASIGLPKSGKVEFASDIDVTFSHAEKMYAQGFKAENWIHDGTKPGTKEFLLDSERAIVDALGIGNYQEGRLFSLVTQFSRQKLLGTTEGSHIEYMTRPSPIVVEVGARQIIIHVHLLREGSSQVETVSFRVNQ